MSKGIWQARWLVPVALLAPLASTKPVAAPKQAVVAKSEEFRLDLHAVSRIMNETKEVARILHDAMDVEEDEEAVSGGYSQVQEFEAKRSTASATAVDETTAVIERTERGTGPSYADETSLDRRYQPFLEALLAKPTWTLSDARNLAKSHHVMLNGAIEVINEWSHEQFGDWLIEDGDPLVIHSTILPK